MGVLNIFNSNVGGSLSNSIGGYNGALVRIKPLVDMDIKGVYASVASEQSRLISPRIYRGSTVIASGPEKLGTTVAGGEATYFPLDSVVTLNANQIYYVGVFSHSVTVFSKGVGDETVSDVFFEKGTYAPLNFSSIWGYSFGIGLERVVNNPPTLNLTSPIGNLIPGTGGNCEDLSKWLVYSADVVTLSNTGKKYGSSSFKFTNSNNNGHRYKDNIQLDATKYYLALVDVFVESFSSGAYRILIPDSGGFNNSINATANTSKIGVWQNVYLKFTGKGNARVSLGNGTNTTGVAYMDGVRIYEIDKATYDKIDVDPNYTGERLAQKFPYTDPTISQTLVEGNTYKIEGTVSDTDAGNVLSVKYSIAGGPTQTIPVGASDGANRLSFSKTLTYSQGRFWDGQTDVSGLLPAETSSLQIWANDGIDDSAKVTHNFTIVQDDGKLYVPVNVVTSAYLTSNTAPPVRLSNGWLVVPVYSGITVYLYISKNNGKTFELLGQRDTGTVTGVSIVSKGNSVFLLVTIDGTKRINLYKINPTDEQPSIVPLASPDSDQTAFGACSITINQSGTELHAVWQSRNSKYSLSFNLRYSRGTINSDGSVTWGTVEQLTTTNSSSASNGRPIIAILNNGNPIVVYGASLSTTDRRVMFAFKNTDSWVQNATLYQAGPYIPISKSSVVDISGVFHTVWQGTDANDTVNPWIYYSNSKDNGIHWLAAPRKLLKGQNASISSDKNGKLTITYDDGGDIKRIESTDEFSTFSGPFVIGQGTNPVTFFDQTFQTDFSIPPTIYQSTGAVKYYGVLHLNKQPVVTLDTPDNQSLTELATLRISGNTLDEDADNVVTTKYQINNGPIRNLQSGLSDGVTPILFARNLNYRNKRIWDGATDVTGVDLAENIDHVLTVWAVDDHGGKSPDQTRKFRVVWNRPPVISDQDRNLGIMEVPPEVAYSVTDPENNPFTVTEKINGQEIRSYAGVADRQENLTIPKDKWLRLEPGVQHTLTIEATDNQGMTSTRTYTLTRFVDKIIFHGMNYSTLDPTIRDKFTTDVAAKRILVSPVWDLPLGANVQVEVTNNAYDVTPTYEDATLVTKMGRAHLFDNTQKTADKWGINFRIRIEKGTAISPIHLKGVGGAFD